MNHPTNVRSTDLKSRMRLWDMLSVGSSGLRTRRVRAALSVLGITIGVAALVGILGLSQSGSADLLEELDALGTNLLTVEAADGFRSQQANLSPEAAAMISRIAPVYEVSAITKISGGVFLNDLIQDGRTKGITIVAADLNLLRAHRGSMKYGEFLNEMTSRYPFVVLGSVAAERLGISNTSNTQKVWLKEKWFIVSGVLEPLPLAADLDRSAIIGYPAAEEFLDNEEPPEVIYIRAYPEHIHDVRSVMPATVNPENPEEVQVGRASDVLEARIAASDAFLNLFVGLGAVALLVGTIGIANVMVIAVIERRNEIGLRRALGATKFHIATQFLTESFLLSTLGGITGVMVGMLATAAYAIFRDWSIVIPVYAIAGGILSSILIGVIAGFYPAMRAANISPTEALRIR